MACTSPIISKRMHSGNEFKVKYSCGRCLACKIKAAQEWTLRIILESQTHKGNWFITLTYSPETMPRDGLLLKSDLQKFFKRLRKNTESKLRYFGVGEYGEKTHRPHYHAVIFTNDEITETDVQKSWGKGHVQFAPITKQRARYVAGYTTKKISSRDIETQSRNEHTFAIMSRRPGIGLYRSESIARSLAKHGIQDTPNMLRCANKKYPIGRTLRDKIAKHQGAKETTLQDALVAHNEQTRYDVGLSDPDDKIVARTKHLIDRSDRAAKKFQRRKHSNAQI